MGRRNDTLYIGNTGEAEVARLLRLRGWDVINLNEKKKNFPTYDLHASKNGISIEISVKMARAKRQLRFGHPNSLQKISDKAFIIALLPIDNNVEIEIESQGYELWIVPGTARHDALRVHLHYHRDDLSKAFRPSENVMLKDKTDRLGGRSISGAAFQSWRRQYRDAWNLLPSVDHIEGKDS